MVYTRFLTLVVIAVFISAFGAVSAAQLPQTGSQASGQYPGATPPTFPSESNPASTMPPDTSAPPATGTSNDDVERRITDAIARDKSLREESLTVDVSVELVTLAGDVSRQEQRGSVLRIAGFYAEGRKIVDAIRVRAKR